MSDPETQNATWRLRRHGVLLRIAYDGMNYSGLAVQDNARTVAGELERCIRLMDPNATSLRVCSRTDAGVHAREQFVAFQTDRDISSRGWVLGIGDQLPAEIAILSAAKVEPGFEPSRRSIGKTYRYTVLQGPIKDPFLHGRCWRVFERLNHPAMRDEIETLLGTHDFRAFRGRGDKRENTVRTIHAVSVQIQPENPRLLDIRLSGTAFLYHMVRIIAGSLVDIGRGKLDPGSFRRAIESGDRLALGMTAPAAGLCLERIRMAETGRDEWPYHLDRVPDRDATD